MNVLARLSPPETNLHTTKTSFVGREQELASLDAMLERHDLVTVTGPPGIGKTRLVTEYALARCELYEGGTLFCDLSEAVDLASMFALLCDVLGVARSDERTLG